MNPYGKTAQTAIAAVSRLAEVYDPAKRLKLNSADIAGNRHLPQPVVAKVLTILSQANIVNGLARPRWRVLAGSPTRRGELVRRGISVRAGG